MFSPLISPPLMMLTNRARIFPMIGFDRSILKYGVATMEDENKIETAAEASAKSRRAFVRGAAKAAVVAPAVLMLLNATTKSAMADPDPYGQTQIDPP